MPQPVTDPAEAQRQAEQQIRQAARQVHPNVGMRVIALLDAAHTPPRPTTPPDH